MNRGLLRTVVVFWLLNGGFLCSGAILSPGSKPPANAGSSGGLGLKAPFAANVVGSRPDVGRSGGSPPSPPKPQAGPPQEDNVIREETEDIKEVNGQPVRVVKGKLAYDSPEGLPVEIKYEADENGNRASFTIGSGKLSGSGSGGKGSGKGSGGGKSGGPGGKSGGAGSGSRGGGSGGGYKGKEEYLPPMGVDKSYLPPS